MQCIIGKPPKPRCFFFFFLFLRQSKTALCYAGGVATGTEQDAGARILRHKWFSCRAQRIAGDTAEARRTQEEGNGWCRGLLPWLVLVVGRTATSQGREVLCRGVAVAEREPGGFQTAKGGTVDQEWRVRGVKVGWGGGRGR